MHDVTSRISIFGDIHGNAEATRAMLTDIDRDGVDRTYCLENLVGYGASPNEVIDLIRQRDIPTIMGNYDDGVGYDRDDCGCAYRDVAERERGQRSLMWTRLQVDADRKAWLQALPPEIRIEEHRQRIRLVHGSPRSMNEYLFEYRDPRSLERIAAISDWDVLVFGHTHIPWDRVIGSVRFINAGSAGKPKGGDPRAAWLLLELTPERVTATMRRVDYDIDAAASLIRASEGLPGLFAGNIETGGHTAPRASSR